MSGSNSSRTVIFTLKISIAVLERRFFEDAELPHCLMDTFVKLNNRLIQEAISKCLENLGTIQLRGKHKDVKRPLFVSEQLVERQRQIGFLLSIVAWNEKWFNYVNRESIKFLAMSTGHLSSCSVFVVTN